MAWLGTWANRIEIDIDNTNIDADLTHFPVLIKLGHYVGKDGQDTGCVFDELTTNYLKLAMTDEDGVTELYVEVEQWDNVTPLAFLWASSSTFIVHADRPTKIYLYYDASQDDNTAYVGVPDDVVSESVWDANFLLVDHMADGAGNDSTYDSTSNDNDGAKLAANEPIQTTGKVGHGQLFDNNDDFIETAAPVIPTTDFTLSALVNVEDFATYQTVMGQIDAVEAGRLQFLIEQTTGKLYLQITTAEVSDSAITAAIWQAVDITRVGTLVTFYNHGDPDGTATLADNVSQDDPLEIGRSVANRMLGSIDEVRISDVGRSAAFIKAQKESAWDNLCSYNFCGDWLQSWKQRIAITIDSSLIDSDLTHFPVMIRIGRKTGVSEQDLTRVFDEVGVEDQKIAVTDDTGTQQLYVEVEKWDATNEEAILWVSRADWVISSSVDTVIYLYYDADMADNTYFVDVPDSTPAERVWDEYFMLVDHMQDDPDDTHTRDSTSHDHDGTKGAAGEPTETAGKIGEGQNLDGGDDITIPSHADFDLQDEWTVECILRVASGYTTRAGLIDRFRLADTKGWVCEINHVGAGKFGWYDRNLGWKYSSAINDGEYHSCVIAGTDGAAIGQIYVDGAVDGAAFTSTEPLIPGAAEDLTIGLNYNGDRLTGDLDEIRISNTQRSTAWLKATHNACFDTLIAFAVETATWKSGWDKRIKITVDHTKIDAALEWFPLMIRISGSCGASAQDMTRVFDELGVEDLKIAITEADGITELYVEVEKWDSTNEEAILWVARDGFFLSSIVDTILYLYYDADHANNTSYVGVPDSAQAEAVWDANFILTDHMQDDPDDTHTRDSTSNDNDSTKGAAGEPTEIVGKIGKAQDFDGNDYLALVAGVYQAFANSDDFEISILAYIASSTPGASGNMWGFVGNHAGNQPMITFGHSSGGTLNALIRQTADATANIALVADTAYLGGYHWLTLRHDASDTNKVTLLIDGVEIDSDNADALTFVGADFDEGNVGALGPTTAASDGYYTGILDEVRVSDINRTTAWDKATKHTCWDSMIAFSIEGETIPEVLVDIAWKGDAMAATPDWYAVDSAGGSDQGCTRYHFGKGRMNSLARMQTGQADLVLKNFDGYYWPDKRNGPWYPYVIAGIKMRIRCVYDGTLYPRFVGFIDEWIPGWLGSPGEGAIMTVTATDGMEHLSNTVLNEDPGVLEGLSGTQVDDILDFAGWPALDRDTSPGAEVLQAHDPMADVNAMDHINKVNESELGILFVAFNGDMTWHGRAVRDASPYDVPLATFGDDLSEMPYIRLKSIIDRELLYNEVRLTIIGGAEQTAEDTTSQNQYGKRTLSRTGLLNKLDIQAEVIASYLVGRYKNATTLRVQQISLLPRAEAADLFPKAFLYDISTRICCRLNEAKLDRDYFIEGVEESAEANTINWRTSWQLSDVSQQLFTPEDVDETIRPMGAGFQAQLGKNTGAANWDHVEETPSDEDTTYVYDDDEVAADYDLYAVADPTYGKGTINKVTVHCRVRTDDAGAGIAWGEAYTFIRTNANNYEGTKHDLFDEGGLNYFDISTEYADNPQTTDPWTWAEVDAMEAGVRLYPPLVLGVASGRARCTQVWVVVNFTPTW